MKYIYLLLLSFIFLFPGTTCAYVPLVVSPESDDDIRTIESPETSQTFYSELKDFPHMYRIIADEAFTLTLTVGVPERADAEDIVHGIVLRQLRRGGVEEIARLSPKEAEWTRVYEPISATYYRSGPSYKSEIPAGEYLIEMSTPDNRQPYLFTIGTQKGKGVGYFEMLGRLSEVKKFYGQSPLALIFSPLLYIPLLVLVLVGALTYYWWRQKRLTIS